MGSTFHSVTLHVIFACKDRRPLITPEIAARLYPYIGGIVRRRDCVLLEGGGFDDHAHLLIGFAPRHAVSDVLRDIKANTSKWIHEEWPKQEFAWQEGYGVFSVSISHIDKAREYIRNQAEHHKKHSFADELRRFKEVHGLADEPDALPAQPAPEGKPPSPDSTQSVTSPDPT
ncbi:MAG: IS200/IS605 family transposase [Planctomycetes bacterium]|nr:IS200/IS605 family transposase [Planctomycetota bacterium]